MAPQDLDRLFDRLRGADPDQAARCLADFARQHAEALSFDEFPLPPAAQGVLCAYELQRDTASGLTLYLHAIRAGATSAVHDHATWAVIVGVHGREINQVYERTDDGRHAGRARLRLSREVAVGPGDALVLPQGGFHRIQVPPEGPALQLHLYGQALDEQGPRHAVDLASGRLVPLVPAPRP